MNNMKNFAAQQLSKKQMNEVKGGSLYHCTVSIGDAPCISGPVYANSSMHAAAEIALVYQEFDDVHIACV